MFKWFRSTAADATQRGPTEAALSGAAAAWSVMAALSGAACNSFDRDDPTLEQKCARLEAFCDGHPLAEFRHCFEVGRDGLSSDEKKAQCFTAYDRCIDECRAYHSSRAGWEAGADGSVPAPQRDAASVERSDAAEDASPH